MQAQTTAGNPRVKRFGTRSFALMAVGVGIAASIAVGAIIVRSSETAPASSVAGGIVDAPLATELGSYTYTEQNVDLPAGNSASPAPIGFDGAGRSTGESAAGSRAVAVQPFEVTRFIEQNSFLPGSSTADNDDTANSPLLAH